MSAVEITVTGDGVSASVRRSRLPVTTISWSFWPEEGWVEGGTWAYTATAPLAAASAVTASALLIVRDWVTSHVSSLNRRCRVGLGAGCRDRPASESSRAGIQQRGNVSSGLESSGRFRCVPTTGFHPHFPARLRV